MKKINSVFLFILLSLLWQDICFGAPKNANRPATFSADSCKVRELLRVARNAMNKGNFAVAIALSESAYQLATKINYRSGIGHSLNSKSLIISQTGDFDNAISIAKKALVLGQDINDSVLQVTTYLILGNSSIKKGNDLIAIDYYLKGLGIAEKLPSQPNLMPFLNNIGCILMEQKNYREALEYFIRGVNVEKANKNTKPLGPTYNNLGTIYMNLGNYKDARISFEKAFAAAKSDEDNHIMNFYFYYMADLYLHLKQYDKAYFYTRKFYNVIIPQPGFKELETAAFLQLAEIQMNRGKYDEAKNYLQQTLILAKEADTKPEIRTAYFLLADLYKRKNEYKKAYDFYQLYAILNDTILIQNNIKIVTEMRTKYATEKKEREIELLKKNEKIQNLELVKKRNELGLHRTLSIVTFIGFLLLLLVALLILGRYRLKEKNNLQLQHAYDVIEKKNKAIERGNELIQDSIAYAKRIQDAVLPSMKDLTSILPNDFFILYQPAQIVSGDFYWCSTQNNKIIFVVANCTGHGVPGAFMSMIGNTLLNEVVNELKITDTQKIARLLDEKIIQALHQYEGSQQYDGIDMSICCIDPLINEVSFTGAHQAMYLYSDSLHKIKGSSFSLGGAQHQHSKVFTSEKINYQKGQHLYFLTSGYCDQHGGNANKRFSSRRLEALLKEIKDLSMSEQKDKLEQTIEHWKGKTKQRDDMLVVGIKC